jgi:hypothetical protein
MIRINLLKNTSGKRTRAPAALPFGAIIKTLVAVIILMLVVVSGMYAFRWWKNRPEKPPAAAVKEGPRTSPEAKAPKVARTEEEKPVVTDFEPSTHVQQTMVEDVVSDVPATADKGARSVLAGLSYTEMSRGEQMNYEYTFAKNVLQILTKAVPEGIGFSSFSMDNFQTVSAVGYAPNRDLAASLFTNLRREKFEVSNPPNSYIRPSGRQGFRFSFTCDVPLGSNPADPWLLTDHLESRSQLGAGVRAFTKAASRSGVFLSHGLTHIKTSKTGAWRRSVYHFTGKGSYRNFVGFVLQVNRNHSPCAFSTIHLRARSSGSVEISADVVFTTRE